jgi:hypothetical protein
MTTKNVNTGVTIKAPNIQHAQFQVVGTAPYVQHKFSQKARQEMLGRQTGAIAKGTKNKAFRDVESEFEAAIHYAQEGWYGIPAPAFRAAMIDACRLVGFKMTVAKLSVFVEPDGFDRDDGSPLVKLDAEAPERSEMAARLETGVAMVTIRPMWRKWGCNLNVKFDGDQFNMSDVANLLMRAGLQVGIGEGRPNSKRSNGMGWGTFEIT